jgi:predicted dehydrogenase
VQALVGTSQATVDEALADFSGRFGLSCRGHLSVEQMLDRETLDVIAICSPPSAHRRALTAACEAGLHALCEKPLWWEAGTLDAAAGLERDVRELAEGFLSRNRLLALNTQWPATLPVWRRLHPQVGQDEVASFSMLMSPASAGPEMLIDSLPHVLSMLHALVGCGTARQPGARFFTGRNGGAAADLRFVWEHATGRTMVDVVLRQCSQQPRPAGYAINDVWALREIAMPDYSMSLVSSDKPQRREPLPDPLDALVAGFAADAAAGRPTDVEVLVESMTVLRDLVDAAVGTEEVA